MPKLDVLAHFLTLLPPNIYFPIPPFARHVLISCLSAIAFLLFFFFSFLLFFVLHVHQIASRYPFI